MDDPTDDTPEDEALTECEEKVEELKEENAQLRNAAKTFGDLAERLNAGQRQLQGQQQRPEANDDVKSLPDKGLAE